MTAPALKQQVTVCIGKAGQTVGQLYASVLEWRTMALSPQVGLVARELEEFAPAFEHDQMDAARGLMACGVMQKVGFSLAG